MIRADILCVDQPISQLTQPLPASAPEAVLDSELMDVEPAPPPPPVSLIDMPNEIIQHIFKIGHDDYVAEGKHRAPYAVTVPICRKVRDNLNGTASFYSNLSYKYGDDLTRFVTWLDRSQGAPLTLNMDLDQGPTSTSRALSPAILLLIKHLPRVVSLELAISKADDWIQFAVQHAPELKKLTIRGLRGLSFLVARPNFAPQLQHLSVDGLEGLWGALVTPSLISLTCLNLPSSGAALFIKALRTAVNLEYLRLSTNSKKCFENFSESKVRLPNLRDLVICGSKTYFPHTIRVIAAPGILQLRLHDLSLHEASGLVWRNHGYFPSVTHLEVWNVPGISRECWATLHKTTPNLNRISTNAPMEALSAAMHVAHKAWFPKLTDLIVGHATRRQIVTFLGTRGWDIGQRDVEPIITIRTLNLAGVDPLSHLTYRPFQYMVVGNPVNVGIIQYAPTLY